MKRRSVYYFYFFLKKYTVNLKIPCMKTHDPRKITRFCFFDPPIDIEKTKNRVFSSHFSEEIHGSIFSRLFYRFKSHSGDGGATGCSYRPSLLSRRPSAACSNRSLSGSSPNCRPYARAHPGFDSHRLSDVEHEKKPLSLGLPVENGSLFRFLI